MSTASRIRSAVMLVIGIAVLTGVVAYAVRHSAVTPTARVATPSHVTSLKLVRGSSDTLELSKDLVQSLGVRTAQVERAQSRDQLKLSGSLFLDSNRMVRVHARFPGEVVSIGHHQNDEQVEAKGKSRPIRLGDRVTRNQLLAVIWSKDVGEKKSDLVNALSKLYLDDAQLKSLRSLGRDVIAERQVREAEREREATIIEVDRLERTLRSWRLTEAEINVVRAEAENIHRGNVVSDVEVDKSWAEIEVRSPIDGIVLEKNIVAGDIVDTSLDLFKIADLSVLGVMANVYEDDLAALDTLSPQDRHWTVMLKSQQNAPGISGTFDLIGNIVDPNQHTAAVMGWLENKDGRLRAGQFITATVDLPAAAGEVVVPDSALVQDGTDCHVFVASDSKGTEVRRRRVALVGRGHDVVFIRSQPCAEESTKGCTALEPGEWVVTAGSIELDGALQSVLATTPSRDSATN